MFLHKRCIGITLIYKIKRIISDLRSRNPKYSIYNKWYCRLIVIIIIVYIDSRYFMTTFDCSVSKCATVLSSHRALPPRTPTATAFEKMLYFKLRARFWNNCLYYMNQRVRINENTTPITLADLGIGWDDIRLDQSYPGLHLLATNFPEVFCKREKTSVFVIIFFIDSMDNT